jgi:hypothetical protein
MFPIETKTITLLPEECPIKIVIGDAMGCVCSSIVLTVKKNEFIFAITEDGLRTKTLTMSLNDRTLFLNTMATALKQKHIEVCSSLKDLLSFSGTAKCIYLFISNNIFMQKSIETINKEIQAIKIEMKTLDSFIKEKNHDLAKYSQYY